jgi:predicted DNA-binding transcriptional regulator YafY
MPINKYALMRYRIIDRCLTNSARPFPSREDLRAACEEQLYGLGSGIISLSTIDKDIASMKNEGDLGYYAPIAYDRARKGYYYADENYTISEMSLGEDELSSIRFAAAILDQFRNVPILNTYGHAIDKIVSRLSMAQEDDEQINQYIQFEQNVVSKGIERLAPLLKAIKERKLVYLDYQSFRENKVKNYEVHPKLLKEYDDRWYLIGYVPDRKAHLTFGLERIVDAIFSESHYQNTLPFDALAFFQYSIGITETKAKAKPEKIVFRIKTIPGRLVKTQPLHSSQQVTKENDEFIEFQLNVYPSPELFAKLMSFGADLEIISPEKIRLRFKENLLQALAQYPHP